MSRHLRSVPAAGHRRASLLRLVRPQIGRPVSPHRRRRSCAGGTDGVPGCPEGGPSPRSRACCGRCWPLRKQGRVGHIGGGSLPHVASAGMWPVCSIPRASTVEKTSRANRGSAVRIARLPPALASLRLHGGDNVITAVQRAPEGMGCPDEVATAGPWVIASRMATSPPGTAPLRPAPVRCAHCRLRRRVGGHESGHGYLNHGFRAG